MIGRFGAIDDDEGGSTSRFWTTATLRRPAGPWAMKATGYASRYDFNLFSNFTFFLENPEDGDMIEQIDRRYLGGGRLELSRTRPAGSVILSESVGSSLRMDQAEVGLWMSPDRDRGETIDHAWVSQQSAAAWGNWTALIGSKVRVSAGLRADAFVFGIREEDNSDYSRESAAILSPKASLVYTPTPGLDLFLSAGSGFHSNDARSVVRGGEDSTPLARANGAEVGIKARPGRHLTLSAAAWRLDIDREFVFVGDAGVTELSGATRRTGLDLTARAVAGPFELSSDATFTRARFTEEPEGADAIPLAPRVTFSSALEYQAGRFVTALRAVHLGQRPLNEDRSLEADPQTLLNLNAGYRIGQVSLDAAILNLTDTAWNEAQFATESRLSTEPAPVEELHFTPGLPRSFRLGVGIRF